MRNLRRLLRGERGQVLYLTLVMIMVLTLFSLVLANAAYLVVRKVRAQDLADTMALSGATLQARLLNRITNLNGILYGGVEDFGVGLAQYGIYSSTGHLERAHNVSKDVLYDLKSLVVGHREHMGGRMGALLGPQGWDQGRMQLKVHSTRPEDNLYPRLVLAHVVGNSSTPSMVMPSIDVLNEPWSVQSRVVLRTRDRAIGGALIGSVLPDIVARARAEVVDRPPQGTATSWNHDWHVRLVQPDDGLDAELQGAPATVEASGEPIWRKGVDPYEKNEREEP